MNDTRDQFAPVVETVEIDGGRKLYLFTFPTLDSEENAPEERKKGPPEAESGGQLLG